MNFSASPSPKTQSHSPSFMSSQHKQFDMIVIGGGASGLMCAGLSGQKGLSVLVLDKANKVGKKILMSGGGRCNFTNYFVEPDNFICSNPHFVKSALSRYTQWDFISLVEKYGIPYHERKHGELFCDNSAKDILNMLLEECPPHKVDIRTKCEIEAVAKDGEKYLLKTNLGNFATPRLVVASGGLSIPTMGASGFGYQLAEQLGHTVLPTRAGLVPFTFSDKTKAMTERLSGLAHESKAFNKRNSFTENILFTHRGISGPAALQLSNYWVLGEHFQLDLFPTQNIEEILLTAKAESSKSKLRSVLSNHLAKSLVLEMETLYWNEHKEKPIGEYSDKLLRQIADTLQNWSLKPSGTEGYRTAEVTLGGVDTKDISSKNMESKLHPGLFFIGEVLDVTGHLGGFNFQWAWASANAVSESLGAQIADSI